MWRLQSFSECLLFDSISEAFGCSSLNLLGGGRGHVYTTRGQLKARSQGTDFDEDSHFLSFGIN